MTMSVLWTRCPSGACSRRVEEPLPSAGRFLKSRYKIVQHKPSRQQATGARPELSRFIATRCQPLSIDDAWSPIHSEQEQPVAGSNLKIIGVGARGISAMKKLAGSITAQGTELWAIDSDKKTFLGCSPSVRIIDVQPSDDNILSSEDLQWLGGSLPSELQEGAAPAQGAAFVLGSAFGSPGGSPLMLQLVNHLRRCGYFVVVGMTRPFTFEGTRKLEQADALIEAMEDVASMVVVIDQNVLTRASSELTMSEASAIADNTLEYTVRSLLSALHAPEILNVTKGTFLWHGRDLRLMKRPLFPPMMHLMTCPGVGNLGRGQASIPFAALQQAGLPSALSTLAEDAVKAASESPFLENKVACSTAALCVLLLPPSLMNVEALGLHVPSLNDHQREYALRSAIQVAAMTVQELAGPQCTDIIVCPQARDQGPSGVAEDPGVLTLECALLALQAIDEAASSSPAAAAPSAAAAEPAPKAPISPLARLDLDTDRWQRQQQRPQSRSSSQAAAAAGSSTAASTLGLSNRSAAAAAAAASGRSSSAAGRTRIKTDWSAMSKIAGGSAASPPSLLGRAAAAGDAAAGKRQPSSHASKQAQPASPLGSKLQDQASAPSGSGARPAGPATTSTAPGAARPGGPQQGSRWMEEMSQQIPRLADSLVTSLVAQSLDLPPRAARWRHQQRASSAAPSKQPMFQLPEMPSKVSPGDGSWDGDAAHMDGQKSRQSVNVRSRVAGMLQNERDYE